MPQILDMYTVKRGDTLPALRRILKFDNGNVQDLSTATAVNFIYSATDGGSPEQSGQVVRTANIVNSPGTDGLVEWTPIAADTAVVGRFLGEFEVLFGADRLTFPNGEGQYIQFVVGQDVDDAP